MLFKLIITSLLIQSTIVVAINESISIESRVIDGSLASAEEFPWNVLIQVERFDTARRMHFFSGTLIDASWVLTQAEGLRNASRVFISVGSNEFMGFPTFNNVVGAGLKNYIHPLSKAGYGKHNIALIKLAEPLNVLGALVRPIAPLGSNRLGSQWYGKLENTYGKICGFGSNRKKLIQLLFHCRISIEKSKK